MRDSIERGEAPFASHLIYTQGDLLDDNVPAERQRGIACGLEWGTVADLVAVYTDLGISEGMARGIEHATEQGLPVVYRKCIAWRNP